MFNLESHWPTAHVHTEGPATGGHSSYAGCQITRLLKAVPHKELVFMLLHYIISLRTSRGTPLLMVSRTI